ncbi:glycosyltransferase [Clostridium thermobutyricum]
MKIGVVIVTYNRLELLKKSIEFYTNQTKKPKYIIIVNNNSTDKTKEFLKEWNEKKDNFDKYVINLDENTGGSGGFYIGLKKAAKLDAEWIWVGDDDAFPEKNAFSKAEEYIEKFVNKDMVAICGSVINNGEIDLDHRRRIKKGLFSVKEVQVGKKEYENESFILDEFSYVGTMINKNSINDVGLTRKEYFIYYDDTEHSLRLRKKGKIICFPKIRINHNVNPEVDNISWKNYYGYRNLLSVYKIHFGMRYYIYKKLKLRVKCALIKDKRYSKLIKHAIRDCDSGNFGINNIYKPGAKL